MNNKISFATGREWYGLYFDLLVDGKPIQHILEFGDEGIPYWLITDGLPSYHPDEPSSQSEIKLVAVCSCGEEGCGHTRCTVTHVDNVVIFEDFIGERDHARQQARFVFDRADFVTAIDELTRVAKNEKRSTGFTELPVADS